MTDYMPRMHVKIFGSIENCVIKLEHFTIFTGPQASGKSTFARLIYFFEMSREVIVVLSTREEIDWLFELEKILRNRFQQVFGNVSLYAEKMMVRYEIFATEWIKITQGEHPQSGASTILFDFSDSIKRKKS